MSYTVRINDNAYSATLTNVATPDASTGGLCTNQCTTTASTLGPEVEPPEILPGTGSNVLDTMQWALTLVAAGIVLLIRRRRRVAVVD